MRKVLKHFTLFLAFLMLNGCSDEKKAEKLESKMQGTWINLGYRPAILTVRGNEWYFHHAGPWGCAEIECMIDYINRKEISLYDCFERERPGCSDTTFDRVSIDDSKRWISFPSKSELCIKWREEGKCDEDNIYNRK